MRKYGSPYHIGWRPGVQSSHLTTPELNEQCEFNPNAEVMDPHQDVFWNDSIWTNMSAAAQTGGFSLGWGLRTTEEILTANNQSATIVVDAAQSSGYRINPGQCVNFEGFFGDEIGNASSPDSDGRGIRWGNLLGAQTERLLARFRTLVGRGVRAFCEFARCLSLQDFLETTRIFSSHVFVQTSTVTSRLAASTQCFRCDVPSPPSESSSRSFARAAMMSTYWQWAKCHGMPTATS